MTLTEAKADLLAAAMNVESSTRLFWLAADRYARILLENTPEVWRSAPLRLLPTPALEAEASALLLSVESMHKELAAELLRREDDAS